MSYVVLNVIPVVFLIKNQIIYSSQASDVWSMGVTLYALVTGVLPWRAEGAAGLYSLIKRQPLAFPSGVTLPPALCHLISKMLDKDPPTRITLPEIKVIISNLSSPDTFVVLGSTLYQNDCIQISCCGNR